jgi:biotin carboxyl carrier protein
MRENLMRYFVTIQDEVLEVEVVGDRVLLAGEPVEATLHRAPGSNVHALRLGHRTHAVVGGARVGDVRSVHVDGEAFRVEVVDERTRRVREMSGAAAAAAGPKPVKAPMPGLVVKVEVAVGETVQPGQGLVIVEAMKMENELTAEVEAVVEHILVEPGQAVEKDQVLLDFRAPEPEEESA